MSVIRRSCLYLFRKKVRSILLYLILFAMGLFILVGLSIRSSADRAAQDMRKSISTGLEIRMAELSGDRIYDISYNDKGEIVRTLKLPLITESAAEELTSIEGAGGYFGEQGAETMYTGLELHPGYCTKYLEESEQIRKTDPGDTDEYIESYKVEMHANDYRIVEESKDHPHFRNGALELVEGRHLGMGDSRKILISEELAERNGLRLGDFIDGRNYDNTTGELYGETYHAEIVGIFRINFEQQVTEWDFEPHILENTIYGPFELRHWGQVQYNAFYGRDVLAEEEDRLLGSIILFVEDPEDLGRVEQEVRKNGRVDWSFYTISRYDKDYKAAAKPLLSMGILATLMVVVMTVGALVILLLILAMWMRGRKQEIHILTCLGMGKRTVLAQFLTEIGLVAVIAFLSAWALSGPVTGMVGDALTGLTNPKEDAASFSMTYDPGTTSTSIDRAPVRQAPLAYEVTGGMAAGTFAAMITVSFGAVTAAFLRIRRRPPLIGASSGSYHWRFSRVCRAGEIRAHQRAFLYVTRKIGKSALLFFTLLVLCFLFLFGMSVQFATGRAAAQVRESIGGYFKVVSDYRRVDVENQVNQEVFDGIRALTGIKAANGMDVCYMDTEVSLKPGRFSAKEDGKSHMTRVLGNTDTSLHEYFSLDIFQLVEGRHVEETDRGKALISRELARLNGLEIGDSFLLKMPEDWAGDTSSPRSSYELEIVGLFAEAQPEQTATQQKPESSIPANFVFTDIATTQQIKQDMQPGGARTYSDGAVFFVTDPEQADEVAEQAEALQLFDTDHTKVTVNNAVYKRSMGPLKRLENMSFMLLLSAAVAGVILLTLILTLWERDRIHEAGILMSFGLPKRNILWQHFLECVSIFAVSFCVSALVALPLGKQMGGRLYESVSAGIEQEETEDTDDPDLSGGAVKAEWIRSDASFDMGLQPEVIVLAGFMGIFLVSISVSGGFWVIARRKPKGLLAAME